MGDWGSWEGNSNLQFSFQGIVKDSSLVSAEEEEGEKEGRVPPPPTYPAFSSKCLHWQKAEWMRAVMHEAR